ncbi:cytochrome P450 [Micromonospora sp. b486]|uniref:cytochrome P450 n=1 Tax=Micromonospora sp. b486 TaxID=3053986 RepID=UPI00259D19EA|nr:cytochrome P450 [Micromonospora sp. b486]MDM4778037.1 cytochrome P450 [Micromonospora sp. b486]
MADAIRDAVGELDEPARAGQPVDIGVEQARIVSRAIMKVLFADRISVPDAMRVIEAQDRIATAVIPRIIVPFAPLSLPMPARRTFARAVRIVDDVLVPIVRETRESADQGDDVISTLWQARTDDGRQLDERQAQRHRGDVRRHHGDHHQRAHLGLAHLDQHPELPGGSTPRSTRGRRRAGTTRAPERLTYTRMVLDELLRLYPIGWIIPRRAVAGTSSTACRSSPARRWRSAR